MAKSATPTPPNDIPFGIAPTVIDSLPSLTAVGILARLVRQGDTGASLEELSALPHNPRSEVWTALGELIARGLVAESITDGVRTYTAALANAGGKQ